MIPAPPPQPWRDLQDKLAKRTRCRKFAVVSRVPTPDSTFYVTPDGREQHDVVIRKIDDSKAGVAETYGDFLVPLKGVQIRAKGRYNGGKPPPYFSVIPTGFYYLAIDYCKDESTKMIIAKIILAK